jgi:hypothetical protein
VSSLQCEVQVPAGGSYGCPRSVAEYDSLKSRKVLGEAFSWEGA